MYRKYFSILTSFILLIILSSCGNSNNTQQAIILENFGLLTIFAVDSSSKNTRGQNSTSTWQCNIFSTSTLVNNRYIYIIKDIKPKDTTNVIYAGDNRDIISSRDRGIRRQSTAINYAFDRNTVSSSPVDTIYIESISEIDLIKFMKNILPLLIDRSPIPVQANKYIRTFKNGSEVSIGSRITNTSKVQLGIGSEVTSYTI